MYYELEENAKFPPQMWAECTSSSATTTNACESFNSHYNGAFYTAHPNIFNVANVLVNIQSETYIKINSVGKCSASKVRKLKEQLVKEKEIADYIYQYQC